MTRLALIALAVLSAACSQGAEPAAAAGASVAGNDTNNTVITSERLTFDQKKSVAIFEGKVIVTDPALKIESERLTVSFSNDKKVELIEAEGSVIITRDTIQANAQKAVYTVADGKITLFGNPSILRQKDSLSAETIIFWRNSNRILCEPNAHLTIYSEQNIRKAN